jgi:hypothetical protein
MGRLHDSRNPPAAQGEPVGAAPDTGDRREHAAPHRQHSTGSLRHEHIVIDGRGVEVTEDAVGVTELHLDYCWVDV